MSNQRPHVEKEMGGVGVAAQRLTFKKTGGQGTGLAAPFPY